MGVTSIRLRPEIESPLENLAIKLDRSKNYLINQLVIKLCLLADFAIADKLLKFDRFDSE